MHDLQAQRLVKKERGHWNLTKTGRAEEREKNL
ncbi:hypothetical protein ACVIGA_004645 [Bradyrhizobium sp. USDA 3240]